MLFARANAYAAEGQLFRMLSAHRVVYRTGKVAAEALGKLNIVLRDAWIAGAGFAPPRRKVLFEGDAYRVGDQRRENIT